MISPKVGKVSSKSDRVLGKKYDNLFTSRGQQITDSSPQRKRPIVPKTINKKNVFGHEDIYYTVSSSTNTSQFKMIFVHAK